MRRLMAGLVTLCLGALIVQACGSSDNACEPGRQIDCTCAGGDTGFQKCLDDGSGWGECDCGCEKDCTGLVCGPDPVCGESCGTCDEGEDCVSGVCRCGGTGPDCPVGGYCCGTECVDLMTDNDNCGTCDNACGSYASCVNGSCICRSQYTDCNGTCVDLQTDSNNCGFCGHSCESGGECSNGDCPEDCCSEAPINEYHIDISGMVLDMTTQQGISAALAPISFMDAMANPDPTHLDEQKSGSDGLFQTNCFDVTEVDLGCVMFSDDEGFDGTAGKYFPTGSLVSTWESNDEKLCLDDVYIYAVPCTLVAALDAYTSVDSTGYGFVMGFVVDTSLSRVEGAVIKKGDGEDLVEVIYPNSTFTELDGTATSATGIFVLPHTNFALGITEITADKAGMAFVGVKAAPRAGFCYFATIQAE